MKNMKKTNLFPHVVAVLSVTLLLFLWLTPRQAWAISPTPAPAPPTPVPTQASSAADAEMTPTPTAQGTQAASSGSESSPRVIFNPTGSLKDLALGMLKDVFSGINDTLNALLDDLLHLLKQVVLGPPRSGAYTLAAKPFSRVGVGLFVAMAVLRLVWQQKHALTGEQNDSLLGVVFDIVSAAVMVVSVGALMDWVAGKTFALVKEIFRQITLPQSMSIPNIAQQTIGTMMLAPFWIVGALLALASFVVAFLAVHGMFYILTAMAPIVFTVGMLPPLRWLRRFWWYGFGAVLLAPFVGAAALGAMTLLFNANFGSGVSMLLSTFLRSIWMWASAGLMWSLLFTMTRFSIGASVGMGARLARGVASVVAGLTTAGAAGALAASVGGGIDSLLPARGGGAGGSTGSDGDMPSGGSTGGGGGGTPSDFYEQAMRHETLAGAASLMSRAPLVGGLFRQGAVYHRTLANKARLQGMAARYPQPEEWGMAQDAVQLPYSYAKNVFNALVGEPNQPAPDYLTVMNKANAPFVQAQIEDPVLGPVHLDLWSQMNDDTLSPMAAAVVAVYHREPSLFQGQMDQNRWMEIRDKAQQLLKSWPNE